MQQRYLCYYFAGGARFHIISPEEQRFWERMTFRQFAVFLIRLQALWMISTAIIDATYLLEYLAPPAHFTRYTFYIVVRFVVHLALAILCIRYADRIVSWFVKDIIPKTPPNPHGGANRRQPGGSEPDPRSSAAASGRSP